MRGWILDVTPQQDHLTLWLRTTNQTIPLQLPYQPRFYLHAPGVRFEDYANLIASHPLVTEVVPEFHRLRLRGPRRPVLAVTSASCTQFTRLVRDVKTRLAPRFHLYNGDLPVTQLWYLEQRHYPFEQVEVHTDSAGLRVTRIDSLDSQWAIDYPLPTFRTVDLRLEGEETFYASSSEGDNLLTEDPLTLSCWVAEQDPDIIFTEEGDERVIPTLISRAENTGVLHQLSLSRDSTPLAQPGRPTPSGRAVFRYGGPVFYRPHPFRLRGRLHLDRSHMTYGSFEGLVEASRLTSLPPQRAARNSPGTGINMLQMREAFKRGVLIPETKAQAERYKTGTKLLIADRGGHTFSPRVGVFSDVGELDFSSMYPSLIRRYNISPDSLFCDCCTDDATIVPELEYRLCRRRLGLVPAFIAQLLNKRLWYKQHRHEETHYEERQQALKWLLVTSFGYLGFRAARFGRVESYECVTAYARQTLLQTKALCELKGFNVLHGIVDCLWLQREGTTVEEYVKLSEIIERVIGLPIEFEGRYRWIMFLPCRGQSHGALTHYCGAKEDGTIKVRGIELRRRDTPPLIREFQLDLLSRMAGAEDAEELQRLVPKLLFIIADYVERIRSGDLDPADLAVTRRISRSPDAYRQRCSQAVAAEMAIQEGQDLRPGQCVSYVHTRSHARRPHRRVALATSAAAAKYDKEKYTELLLRAAETLLVTLGWDYQRLARRLRSPTPTRQLLLFSS